MSEDGCADTAGPHPEGGGELAGHLGVAGQVLPQAALVNVELPADRTRVVRTASLGCKILDVKMRGLSSRKYLPGTPEALGSLWTNFMCSINISPLIQSLLQIGQQLGLGPPTKA